jgi:hypothetical protein
MSIVCKDLQILHWGLASVLNTAPPRRLIVVANGATILVAFLVNGFFNVR